LPGYRAQDITHVQFEGNEDLDDAKASEYLTLGQAARLLGVSAKTVDRWARQGRIPFVTTPSGRRGFPCDEIKAIASRTT
jgi:excisionase family DNA binding protein